MTTEGGTTLKPSGETASGDFEPEQKRYLEGFVAGLQIAKTAKEISAPAANAPQSEPTGPEAAARKAERDRLAAYRAVADATDKAERFISESMPSTDR